MRLAYLLLALLVFCAACTPLPTQAETTSLGVAELDCVDAAATRAAADACRAKVKGAFCAKYPSTCDGGSQ